ncbi:hypothetical protein PALS1_008 [Staphylococcus phage PALS_1]|nr:hypothetical protein PALS1_008 [Staphylococcus phage PALS_1]UXR08121.1 hypothetical protein [Staphylococcus phage vB_ScaM-V1SC04]
MLYYKKLLDKKMATVYGTVEIDKDGVVKGLTKEQEKEFANVPGFEFEEEKTTRKQSASTSKEEPKEEEKKASTRKATSTTKKSTARKTTAKKDTK